MTAGRSSFVTPEAVTLTMDLAGVGSRLIATLLDTAILAVFQLVLFVVAAANGVGGVEAAVVAGLGFFVFLGYYVAFETLYDGQTPGKNWQNIRVVRDDGRPASFASVLVRNLVRIVDLLPTLYAIGMITIFVSTRDQRLGDLAAGTVVVHERADPAPEQVSRAPLPSWASTLDVSAVGEREYAVARSFLRRRDEVDHDAAVRLAGDIATRLRGLVPGIPDGVGDHRVIEVVAAAVRERSAGGSR